MIITVGILTMAALFFVAGIGLLKCYKKCPADRILVVFGKVGGQDRGVKCINGGAAFVWPIIQGYQFMDLTPISVEVNLTDALSKQNIRISAPSTFTLGLSTTPSVMANAAQRLLGMNIDQIRKTADSIITGQMRQVIASMTIEEINTNREKLIQGVREAIAVELEKLGLTLINVNIRDVNDKAGYIESLGREAATVRIQDANIKVANAERDGAVGASKAKKEQAVLVAQLTAETRQGENLSLITIAQSDSERRTKEAEANRDALTSEQVALADAEKNSARAQQEAETARAEVVRAKLNADTIVPAEQAKSVAVIQAQTSAEVQIEEARGAAECVRTLKAGEADGIKSVQVATAEGVRAVKLAEAEGVGANLSKRAEGFEKMTKAAGNNPQLAVVMLLTEQMPALANAQATAISNLKFDKVVVWDSNGGEGQSSTANFLRSIAGALPPIHEVAKVAGVALPRFLGDLTEKEEGTLTEKPQHKKGD